MEIQFTVGFKRETWDALEPCEKDQWLDEIAYAITTTGATIKEVGI